MDAIIDSIEKPYLKKNQPDLRAGDKVRVYTRLQEGEKERIQAFEGVLIRRRRGGTRATFTVRKVSYGVGVERTYPFHSPLIEKVEVLERGKVRRSRLYYLRGLTGKSARIKGKKYEGLGEAIAPGQPVQEEEKPAEDGARRTGDATP